MEKATYIAKLLAQLAQEYSAEIARIAERDNMSDQAVHARVQKQITQNESLVLQNNDYFKMKIANRPKA